MGQEQFFMGPVEQVRGNVRLDLEMDLGDTYGHGMCSGDVA